MASRIVLPEFVERRMRHEAMIASADPAHIRYWNRRLQELSPGLALAFPKDVPATHLPAGMVPGRWHVRYRPPVGPDSYTPITGPNGEFREMDSAMLEQLRSGDLLNPRVARAIEEGQRATDASRERAKGRKSEERVDELASRIANKTRPSILFTDDVPFKNKAHARRGRP